MGNYRAGRDDRIFAYGNTLEYRRRCRDPDIILERYRPGLRASDSELPEMMIQMLVRQRCPFQGSHLSEKTVRMIRAFFRATGCEAVSPFHKPLPLHLEIAFIAHDQALVRRHISANRLFIQDR